MSIPDLSRFLCIPVICPDPGRKYISLVRGGLVFQVAVENNVNPFWEGPGGYSVFSDIPEDTYLSLFNIK